MTELSQMCLRLLDRSEPDYVEQMKEDGLLRSVVETTADMSVLELARY